MNLEMPEKEKMSKKRITIYAAVIGICVFSIIIVVGVQILGNDVIDNLFGINKLVKRTEQEEASLKANFESIFDNQPKDVQEYNTEKIKKNLSIIYTYYQKKEETSEHELNINLPYVNISNKEIEMFNKEISNTFESKSKEILENDAINAIYTVKYNANIENKILSLIIYSDLKQGTDAQRVIIQTLNYDLEKNKMLSLEDVINKYNLNTKKVKDKIDNNIKDEERKAEELKRLGYNVFTRNTGSEIYKIENINEFFIYNNNIYIIFAYGNNNMTSEMDIVIL